MIRSGLILMLQGFSGYTQTDGYSGYHCLDSVTHVGCWAHARRKWVGCFVDGKPVQGSRSEAAFGLIEEMFALEQAWKDESPQARFELRQEKLRPLLERYWALLDNFEAAEGCAEQGEKLLAKPEGCPERCASGRPSGTDQ